MKRILLATLAALILAPALAAQSQDVRITVTRKKLDEQKEREGGNTTITTKEVAYKITVENKTFKPFENVQVKYMIFYLDPKQGSREKPVEISQSGGEALPTLAAHSSSTVETKPFKLQSAELDAGWYYADGGSNRSKDRVSGIWVRAYVDGKIVGEYTSPSTVTKNTWKG